MTAGEAARKGHAGGHTLRVIKSQGFELYLADYRRTHRGRLTTPYPAEAEWFEYEHQAKEMAKRASFYTTFSFEVTTAPADARPCKCKVERMPVAEAVCDLAPEDDGLTPTPWDCSDAELEAVKASHARYEAELDEDARRGVEAFNAGPEAWAEWDASMLGLDDDDADMVAASLTPPGSRPNVAGVEVP